MPSFNDFKQPSPVRPPESPIMETAVESGREKDIANVVTHLSGFPWKVDYFAQVLGSDDAPKPLDLQSSPVYQQYHRVNNYILKVDSPVQPQYVRERNIMTKSGTATITPKTIIPTRGDMILADLGLELPALLVVTEVEKLSYMKLPAWTITYNYHGLLHTQYQEDLNRKTVKESYYREDYLGLGKNPIVHGDIVQMQRTLENQGYVLVDWLGHYIDDKHRYLTIPVKNGLAPRYDEFLVETLRKILDTSQYPAWSTLRSYRSDPSHRVTTLWDALIYRDNTAPLARVKPFLKWSHVQVLPRSFFLSGLRYTNVEYFLGDHPAHQNPFDWGLDVNVYTDEVTGNELLDIQNDDTPESVDDNTEVADETDPGETPPVVVEDEEPEIDDAMSQLRPMIHGVAEDGYYVLSEAFYKNDRDHMSTLELVTWLYIHNEPILPATLLTLVEDVINWKPLEQVYYIPILIIIILNELKGD